MRLFLNYLLQKTYLIQNGHNFESYSELIVEEGNKLWRTLSIVTNY